MSQPKKTALASLPRRGLSSLLCWLKFRVLGICATKIRCDGRTPVIYGHGKVSLGPGFSVRGRTARAELGAHRGGTLRIGTGFFLNQGASVVAVSSIEIGDNVLIGDYASISDSDYHAVGADTDVRTKSVVIGSHVWLGRNVIVLPGVTIGDGTVVAAGAVVTQSLPAHSLAVGVPARVVKELDRSEWRRD